MSLINMTRERDVAQKERETEISLKTNLNEDLQHKTCSLRDTSILGCNCKLINYYYNLFE
jgi:hypothetical protein